MSRSKYKDEAERLRASNDRWSEIPNKILQKIDDKHRVASAQYSKFCDDMIKDNKFTNRINAAMEREKIRTLNSMSEFIADLMMEAAQTSIDQLNGGGNAEEIKE